MKFDNISFEMLEEFKYSETALANKNYIHIEIKNRLKTSTHLIIRCRIFCHLVCYPKFKD
jgi:hypothetical protein